MHRINHIGNYHCKQMTMATSFIPIITHKLEKVYFQFRKKRAINFFQMELGLLLHGCSLCFGLLLEGNACRAYLNRLGYYHIMLAQIT